MSIPPLASYQEGLRQRIDALGQTYPGSISNVQGFIIDFLPVLWRTVQRHGFMVDHIAYYSDALRPWIGDTQLGKFLIRRDPRDLSSIYVLDPHSQQYLSVPYRTLARPSITLWEHRQALARLRAQGVTQTNEETIFRAIEAMRAVSETAVQKTRSTRRQSQRRRQAQAAMTQKSGHEADPETSPKPSRKHAKARPFEDIELW